MWSIDESVDGCLDVLWFGRQLYAPFLTRTVYTWDVNGNLETQGAIRDDGSIVTDATYAHDWRDRLVEVEQGDTTMKLVVDPLGRLVAKVKQTGAGDATRVYLHDGDQVVAEYVQEAGGTGYQLDRRKHWGRWIDDLVAEEVDADHDGNLDTTLFPITDMLGSVQLLTDGTGTIVERLEYDADGTPRFFGVDTTAPTVTRVAWTGDGNRPTGDMVAPDVFEIGFDEWVDEAGAATATLTPDGGVATSLSITLDAGARSVTLAGASVVAGTAYTLHLEGIKDRSGAALSVDVPFTVADAAVYEVVQDSVAPQVLAVMDSADGIFLLLDEPVTPAAGVDLADSVTVMRASVVVDGVTTRVNGQMVKWTPDPATWLVLGEYEVTSTQLVDLAGQAVDSAPLPVSLTHLAGDAEAVLVVFEAAGESEPGGESAYGVTSLFQGRTWHSDLGLYYYRWRWYSPAVGQFIGRDPLGHLDSPSLFQFVGHSPVNVTDPFGQSGETYYKQNSERLGDTFNHVLRMDVDTWLTGQDWDGLDHYKKNVKRRGAVEDFQQSGRYAYWIPGGSDFSIVKAISSDWIARSWIRTMGAGSAQKGIGFVLGYPPLLIGEQVRRNDNISMQRARMAQLNVMVYFLDAVGSHAKRDAVGRGPTRWMWSELKWGDDYVSQAARLGTRLHECT